MHNAGCRLKFRPQTLLFSGPGLQTRPNKKTNAESGKIKSSHHINDDHRDLHTKYLGVCHRQINPHAQLEQDGEASSRSIHPDYSLPHWQQRIELCDTSCLIVLGENFTGRDRARQGAKSGETRDEFAQPPARNGMAGVVNNAGDVHLLCNC